MTVQVLKSQAEIRQARAELDKRGLSHLAAWPPPFVRPFLGKLGLAKGLMLGDYIKSWDVLKTEQFLHQHLPLDTPILDIGAYASEILAVLHRLNFSKLSGIDLDTRITLMPYHDQIDYRAADFLHTPYPDEAFGAITAVSVIEHGFQSAALLQEVSRLLCPGGFFVASFDYWPEKIDTTGINIFDLDWRIFSKAEVLKFFDDAASYQLRPFGEADFDAQIPVMKWGGKRYTFAWLVLQKAFTTAL
jgi:SAM-dependent methyltransferase